MEVVGSRERSERVRGQREGMEDWRSEVGGSLVGACGGSTVGGRERKRQGRFSFFT